MDEMGSGPDDVVWIGRGLGLLIVMIALAVGARASSGVDSTLLGGDTLWVFLATAMTPLGVGFLVLVASEILSRLPLREY
jgi:hypothetical protein